MGTSKLEQMPRTLASFAFERIRDAIIIGELRPETKINQAALADQLGVSLVPIREALQKLEAEGLVQIKPRRGAFVSPISRKELEDLYAVRELLEGMATLS